ncbi:MAG: alpha/beta hydrolase [bacterium]
MRINYEVAGAGKPLIMLHGWGGSLQSLAELQNLLSKSGFQVYNLDLPGFGQSEMLKNEMQLEDYVDFVIDFIKKLELKKPILLGHSFGGQIAARLASREKHLLSQLILVNAAGINPANTVKKFIFKKIAKTGKRIFKLPGLKQLERPVKSIFYKYIVRERDYLNANKMKATMANVVETHLEHALVQITVPTLLIWSEKDTYTPLWQGEKMASLISGSRLQVVAGARHNLPLKDPQAVLFIINSFAK